MFSFCIMDYFSMFWPAINREQDNQSSDEERDPVWTAIAYIFSIFFGIFFWIGIAYLIFCYL